MAWKCPACQTAIRYDGDMPTRRRVYRCHVCRLELVLDDRSEKMTVAPFIVEDNRRRGEVAS
jgi:hypothetical protein